MGRTRGEPNEIELTAIGVESNGSHCRSEMSGGVRNVKIYNARLLGQRGIHMKTSKGQWSAATLFG